MSDKPFIIVTDKNRQAGQTAVKKVEHFSDEELKEAMVKALLHIGMDELIPMLYTFDRQEMLDLIAGIAAVADAELSQK